MKKGFSRYILAWLIAFAATIIVAQILPFEKGDLFNSVYYTIIISFAIQLIISSFALNNKNKEISQSIFIFSIVGLIMVFATNYYLIFRQHYHRPWFFAVVNVIVLVLHYIFLIVINTGLSTNADRDENYNHSVDTMRSLTKEVKVLYDNTDNKDIYRLYEALKFADKRSKNIDLEGKIKTEIISLKSETDADRIKDQVNSIIKMINER